jgi:hypothetical protein
MWLTQQLAKRFGIKASGRRRSVRRRPPPIRPAIESLEDRTVPVILIPQAAAHTGGNTFAAGATPTQAVLQASTTTLTSSANPSVVGQQVTFTATVSGTGGIPTGETVIFNIDGTNDVSSAVLIEGVATFTTDMLGAGPHTVSVAYAGDPTFDSSRSGTLTQTVLRTSATALVSSANPSVAGQAVTFTARVTGTDGTPTGNVTFTLDGATPDNGTVPLGTAGTAVYTTSTLTPGTHSVVARYNGDDFFAASTSDPVNQSVPPSASTTTLTQSATSTVATQPVAFTATVTRTGGTPTGTVTFTLDGSVPNDGTVPLNGSGAATYSTTALALGSHQVSATYNGSDTIQTSTGTLSPNHQVTQASTSTALALSPNPSTSGQAVTFTARVNVQSPGTGVASGGTVTFTVDGSVPSGGTVSLDSSGQATFSTSTLTAGSHTVAAGYNGNPTFAPSSSASQPIRVANVPPTARITDGPTAGFAGRPVRYAGTFTDPGAAGDAPYTYTWSVIAPGGVGLPGASGTLASYPGAVPDFPFRPPAAGTYTIALVVTDREGDNSPAAQRTLVVTGAGPVVNLGPDVSVRTGQSVHTVGSFTDGGAATVKGVVSYGDGSAANLTLNPDGTFALDHRYAGAGNYTVTVKISDGHAVGMGSLAVHVLPPARVQGVVINDGSAQRSMVNSVTMTFSTRVDIAAGAFTLVRSYAGTTTDVSGLIQVATALTADGRTVATLTFGGGGFPAASLADGQYTLTLHAGLVTDHALGAALDGDGDGLVGGDRVDHFFRLFGDVTGDGQVDAADLAAFQKAYDPQRGMIRYSSSFDYNLDGVLDATDYAQFQRRLHTRLNGDGSTSSLS